jgi:hypothetical protein
LLQVETSVAGVVGLPELEVDLERRGAHGAAPVGERAGPSAGLMDTAWRQITADR